MNNKSSSRIDHHFGVPNHMGIFFAAIDPNIITTNKGNTQPHYK